jgi:nicotinamidase-related amidase
MRHNPQPKRKNMPLTNRPPYREIISRAAQLARAFRERSLPVVLVNVRGAAPGRTDAERFNLSRPGDWSDLGS